VGGGAAWVTVWTDGADVLWRIDAHTEEGRPLPATSGASWPAVGEGNAWVPCTGEDTSCRGPSVIELDGASGETVATIALPGFPSQITTGLGAVWVSTHGGLVRIDPVSGTTTTFEGTYNFLGVARGSLWATGYDPDRVYRIDPETGAVIRAWHVDDPCTFEATFAAVWVATCSGRSGQHGELLTSIDPDTGRVVARFPIPFHGQMRGVEGALWIAYRDGSGTIVVAHLDPTTGEPIGDPYRVEPGEARFSTRALFEPHVFVAADHRSLWLADYGSGEVIRLGIPTDAPDL
jgi:hypothetical protein